LASGTPGFALHPDLDARPEDPRVIKRCYSALSEGSSDLAEQLRKRGIENVLIGGTTTNVCCESTARDAMLMDFRTVMVDDALAAYTEQEHTFSLHSWLLYFGDVMDVAQVEKALVSNTVAAA
jgi:nicotinamidase-related amidase